MYFVCFYGYLELVIYFWRRGCEINVCDNYNIIFLMKVYYSYHFKNDMVVIEVKMNLFRIIIINVEIYECVL